MWERKVINAEELKQQARILVSSQTPPELTGRGLTLKIFNSWLTKLKDSNEVLRGFDQAGKTLVPAAEWLLDNIYFIKEQALYVQQRLSGGGYQKLPRLKGDSQEFRVFALCQNYLRQSPV